MIPAWPSANDPGPFVTYNPALDDTDDTAAEDYHHDRRHRVLSRGESQGRENTAESQMDRMGAGS